MGAVAERGLTEAHRGESEAASLYRALHRSNLANKIKTIQHFKESRWNHLIADHFMR